MTRAASGFGGRPLKKRKSMPRGFKVYVVIEKKIPFKKKRVDA